MFLPVINTEEYDIDSIIPEMVEQLSVDTILYVNILNRDTIILNTLNGSYTYVFPSTLSAFEKVLERFGFLKLDSGNVVNMTKIIRIETRFYSRIAIFSDGQSASVSYPSLKFVKKNYPEISIIQL